MVVGISGDQSALLPDSHGQIAVVMMTATIRKCQTCRAKSVAASLDHGQDLWVLHRPGPQNAELVSELRSARVRLEAQDLTNLSVAWEGFGSRASGFSKAAFLRWYVCHAEYEYAWHLEDDVFFTGRWGRLLTEMAAMHPTADVLTKIEHRPGTPMGIVYKPIVCRLPQESHESLPARPAGGFIAAEEHAEELPNLSDQLSDASSCLNTAPERNVTEPITHTHHYWVLLRLSHAWATRLAAALSADGAAGARGHHEALSGPLCDVSARCTSANLPNHVVGNLLPGHWPWPGSFLSEPRRQTLEMAASVSEFEGRRIASGTLEPGRLYHPVKCESGEEDVAAQAVWWAGLEAEEAGTCKRVPKEVHLTVKEDWSSSDAADW